MQTLKERNKHGFFLFLGAVFLGFVVFLTNLLRSNIDTDWIAWMYYIPTALGHASLFALVLYLLFYVPLSFFFKSHKIPSVVFIVLGIALQAFLILNVFVFNFYRFHINGFVLELVLHAGKETFVFDSTLYVQFAVLVVFAAILPYVFIFWLAKKWSLKPRKKQITVLCLTFSLCILFSHISHAFAEALRQTSIQRAATALPYFFPLTMNRFLIKMGLMTQDDVDRLGQEVATTDIAYPIHPVVARDAIPNYNILFIVIDSWNPRAFDELTTPNLYRMASQYEYFSNHHSSSNGTRGSLFGIFFGLSFTYQTHFVAAKKSPLLIDQLVHHNYAIQVFPSGMLPTPPFHEIVFRKAPHVHSKIEGDTPFARDQKITQLAIEHMEDQKGKKPFFAFVFYDLPHAISLPEAHLKFQPSWTATNYMALNNNIDSEPFFNLYRSCVYQVDQQIGILLEYVQNSGLMDRTIVIVTGDHGQEFNENRKNYWGHGGNFSKWQIHVPLLLYHPETEKNQVFSHMTTHYDIAPTLLKRYLGIENPSADFSMGYDLYNPTSRYPHIVGDYINYGFVFENAIATTNHLGTMVVTDHAMNPLPRGSINIKELQKAIEKKNMFYK